MLLHVGDELDRTQALLKLEELITSIKVAKFEVGICQYNKS